MSLGEQYNIGARIKVKVALTNTSITQSSAALATSSTGHAVNRNDSGLRRYYSCKAVVAGAFTGASSQRTGALTMGVQHSSDGTSWDAFSTGTAVSATWGSTSTGGSTGATGGVAFNSVEQSVNLVRARQFLRIVLDAPTFQDCSSGSSLAVAGTFVFGGADELPAQ